MKEVAGGIAFKAEGSASVTFLRPGCASEMSVYEFQIKFLYSFNYSVQSI